MGEPPTAADKPPGNGAAVKAGDILGLALRVAPWLAMAGVAAFWRRDRRRLRPKAVLSPEAFDALEPHRGRTANFPWLIPPLGWKDIAHRTYHEYGRARLPALAGGATFYLLLATFPAIAAFVSLYGLFSNVDTAANRSPM